jgi:hypothetical protein
MPPPQLRLWGRSEYRRRRKNRVGHNARAAEFLVVINGGAFKAIYTEVAFRTLFGDSDLLLFRNRLGSVSDEARVPGDDNRNASFGFLDVLGGSF